MRNSGLKRTLEHLRHAELEFLQSVCNAEIDEEFFAVKSELDEFRNLVWSHLAAGAKHGARARQVLESMRMHRIVEMFRTLNQSQRQQIKACVSSNPALRGPCRGDARPVRSDAGLRGQSPAARAAQDRSESCFTLA